MKISAAFFSLVLEVAFIVYCIYMTYLIDILDPFPRDWFVPNALIGAGILLFGLFIASRLRQDQAKF